MTYVKKIFERLTGTISTPKTELDYINPYTLLVAVVLSAQSTDKSVNKATKPLFQIVQTPQAMLDLGLEGLKLYIKTLGLFNNKANNIIKLSRQLIEYYNGNVPSNRDDLMALSGVGRKTANVVLNVAYGHPTIPVDTHVARVAQRLNLSSATHPDKIEADLERVTPAEFLKESHHLLILHGRYTCTARKPKCELCILNDLCPSFKPGLGFKK